jgi:diketogulonate reductase-like aldo/keto reductase
MKFKKLLNGEKIPQIGLGTYQMRGEKGKKAILNAIELGYRLIDTASLYQNEKEVGEAVHLSEIPREEFFITSKVWNSDQGYESTIEACKRSLKRLKMNYLDLYLIHWPLKAKWLETWKALKTLNEEGICKAIGVSNFYIPHLHQLKANSEIVPMVNQVEFHPFLYLEDLLTYCKKNSILLEAYAPLTHGYKLSHPILKNLAEKYQKSPAQIILRWGIEHEIVIIPKALNTEHQKENLQIFDFSLEKGDIENLNQLNEHFHSDWDPRTAID